MASIPADLPPRVATLRARSASLFQRQGALALLVVLIIFGAIRYPNFLAADNIGYVLRYNSMFGLIALAMTFVIMTGGIDLSVGSVAALCSVLGALYSSDGSFLGLPGGLTGVLVPLAAGALIGLINGLIIARLHIAPFITTLGMLLAARGIALFLSNNAAVSVDKNSGFATIGQSTIFGIPLPVLLLALAYIVGALALKYTRFGRHILAVGGNEEAARLMGLPVDRIKISVYILTGLMAALAGMILATNYGGGDPQAGVGWELNAIAAVVVGGTLLTGGLGSVSATLVGTLLLGIILTMLNFENGQGGVSLSAYWQSVVRGVFLLVVVLLQNRLARRRS